MYHLYYLSLSLSLFVEAGKGVPEVIILDPSGNKNTVPVKVRQTSPDLWRCEYVSSIIGLHSVNIFFAGQPIPNSPYGVRISPGTTISSLLCRNFNETRFAASDARKVKASGRGLQPTGVRVNDEADFKIYTDGAGEGYPDVQVIGPGGMKVPCKLKKLTVSI